MRTPRLGLLAALLPMTALATTPPTPDASTVSLDLPALIECRQGVADFAQLSVALSAPDGAKALGWTPLPKTNQFMSEYRLPAPLTVFGNRTDHLALHGGSLMAVLDLADPRPLASSLQLETGFDEADKFIAGREVTSRDIVTPGTGERMIESVILSLSTVQTHPGKTLAGCTYDLDQPEDEEPEDDGDGQAEAAKAESPASPPAG